MRTFFVVLWLSLYAACQTEVAGFDPSRATAAVGFCELVKNPSKYDGHTLLVDGVVSKFVHSTVISASGCEPTRESDSTTLVGFDQQTYKFDSVLDKRLWKVLGENGKVQVTVLAVFEEGKASRFGDQNCCRFRLKVQRLDAVKKVCQPKKSASASSAQTLPNRKAQTATGGPRR